MPTMTDVKTTEVTSNQLITIFVAVSVDNGVATWTYNGASKLIIDVEPGEALIVLELKPNAAYVSNPINWFNVSRQPIATPQQITVSRSSDTSTSILDFNDNQSTDVPDVFHFLISVVIDGVAYTSPDPTIINHKPTL